MIDIRVIPNLQDTLLTILSVGVLLLVLSRKVFGPISELLRKRQEYVQNQISESEHKNQEAERLKREYDEKILNARQESSEIVSSARALGEDIKAKAISESKELARQELEKGKRDLENERLKTMKSMNEEIADIALNLAEKVLNEKMDSNQDKELVKSFIKDLEEGND